MSIIKEQIKFIGDSINLKFSLSSEDNFLGYQQEIDNLTQNVSNELINPALDVEEYRFKYKSNSLNVTIEFALTNNGTSYGNSYLNAGFTQTEINSNSKNMLNSFFIFDIYNTYDINTQTKILTTYITKIGNKPTFNPKLSTNQIYCLYIPLSFITPNIELGITGFTGYCKMSFYNAKNGSVVLFNNSALAGLSSPEKMFYPIHIDFINKTWNFITSTLTLTPKQTWNNYEYINKINNTFTKFNNETQNYPKGSAFDYKTGTYI